MNDKQFYIDAIRDMVPEQKENQLQAIFYSFLELEHIYDSAIELVKAQLNIFDNEFSMRFQRNPIHNNYPANLHQVPLQDTPVLSQPTSMAYNMQVAFATTVVGLFAAAIGFISQQVKQRWYLQDMTNLEFVAELLNESKGK